MTFRKYLQDVRRVSGISISDKGYQQLNCSITASVFVPRSRQTRDTVSFWLFHFGYMLPWKVNVSD